jgi:hypothetical protein
MTPEEVECAMDERLTDESPFAIPQSYFSSNSRFPSPSLGNVGSF